MSKEGSSDGHLRSKVIKSTDLKRRLFEVGLNLSPARHSPVLAIATPKRTLAKPTTLNPHLNSSALLRYQPHPAQNPPKTHSRDFHIRKNSRQVSSPSSRHPFATMSNFHKPDSVRDDCRPPKDPKESRQVREALLCWKQEGSSSAVSPLGVGSAGVGEQSRLDEYVGLVLRGVQHIDQFLYLVRGNEQNIYELQLVSFEAVREHEGEGGFEYYTVSRKGFCQYVGGKPQSFLQIKQWQQQKSLYTKIKALKFFHRFRRWKTLQMWRRTITRQRRETIAHSLQERLFLLEPTTRRTLLELRRLTLEMDKGVLIIARNEGTYTLDSFKHSQERARREASLAVEEFSRESRAVVRKCFESKLSELRETIKKNASEERPIGPTTASAQSPKEGAFQALGFPSKMSYEHRSRLRKQAGRFLRFSYLVDSLHLTCLTGLYSSQVAGFIGRLEEVQGSEQVRLRATLEQGKEEAEREKMFVLQLACSFKEVPPKLVTEAPQLEEWLPSSDIRLRGEPAGPKLQVSKLCEYWLSLQPGVEEVLDQLGFLLREGLGALKCFERWARHREMQKYVSILEEWDDLVSDNWEISENDNLDPLLLMESLDPALARLKTVLKSTEARLTDTVRSLLAAPLHAYWQYSQLPHQKLQHPSLLNPADTFEQFLLYSTKQLERISNELPHRVELGVFSVQLTRVKGVLGQRLAGVLEGFKTRLPELVEERTGRLNEWLGSYGTRLREEILNIDDYVRTVGNIREIEGQLADYREECNELAQVYQTMQQFRIDTRRRKDFETFTLKLKDQLDQLLLAAEQNIERKADLYTKEVQKYHLPALLKDIAKALEQVEQPHFLRLDSPRPPLLRDLAALHARHLAIATNRNNCQRYMAALKLPPLQCSELDELERQIGSRQQLWTTLQEWESFAAQQQPLQAKLLNLEPLIATVQGYYQLGVKLEKELPPNEVLQHLRKVINEYYVHLPLLLGFSEPLSENHWADIYDTLPERFPLDLKRREFSLAEFLSSGVGGKARDLQAIFEKSRVEARLQREYHELEEKWVGLTAKVRVDGKFTLIANGPALRSELEEILVGLACMLENPHAQALRQYSISYESLSAAQQALQEWLRLQERLGEVQKQCRLLDIKKLPDYNFYENAERIYKQISKPMLSKGAEAGVKLPKLLLPALEDKFHELANNLHRVEDNIQAILRDHRRLFPSFYLFNDQQVLRLITEPTPQALTHAAALLAPALASLEFEAERITALVTLDGDRLVKNAISMNSDVEQILFLIVETTSEMHRRALRSCRYKAVENNLSGLTEQYNIQHLLAVSRVDFSHYTAISIDNQQETPDSLAQFRKVMRKDTAEDMRNRPTDLPHSQQPTGALLQKYDTLLLQQLLYEETLDYLIKCNVQKVEEYAWASQLKFFWEDTPADEPNITVRQLHLSLKYGNDYLGSKTKVLLQSEPEVLLGMRLGQGIVYNGSPYALERLVNAVGYKLMPYAASPLTTELALRRFFIGCYFADFFPLLQVADLLPRELLGQLSSQRWVDEFKESSLKRNSPYLKDLERPQSLCLTMRDSHSASSLLGGTMRVVDYVPPKQQLLKSGMRLINVFGNERTSLLLRVFQAVHFLEERSHMQGICLEQFLDLIIHNEQSLSEQQIFNKLLNYLKPKVTIDTHQALSKHLESLGYLPFEEARKVPQKETGKVADIMDCLWSRRVVVLSGKGASKKYFLQKELARLNVPCLEVYGESLTRQEAVGEAHNLPIFQIYAANQQKQVLYFEAVTPDLLLGLQKLLYLSDPLSQQLFSSQTAIVVDIPSVQKLLDPRSVASFPIINYECSREYINSLAYDWPNTHLPEDKRKQFTKVFTDVILPALESLTPKDELILEEKVNKFLMFLASLLPASNMLEVSIYCLLMQYRGSEEQQMKLQFLVKKHIGEDKLPENTKTTQLIYSKETANEGVITQQAYLESWIDKNDMVDYQHLLTPQALHTLTAARRIHDNSALAVCLQGRGNCGKSTLLQLYRDIFHQNSFYFKLSPMEGRKWIPKLTSSLQKHGLNLLGARINYKETILMVDDLHMADPNDLIPLQLMLTYKKCRLQSKEMQLKNVKFMLTAQTLPQPIAKNTLKIAVNLNSQQLKSIFTELLQRSVDPQWDLPLLQLQRIANCSFDLCRKITDEKEEEMKVSFTAMKRMLNGFCRLKLKEGVTVEKEIQKFWAFTLMEGLKSHDKTGILQEQLRKLDIAAYNPTPLSYTHLCSRPTEKRLEFLRDPKRLYNMLNERIERYNESDAKRYGESFQFLNFDSMLEKIVGISHSILMDSDHLLCGRKGTGKESLVRLTAYLNGFHYRQVKTSIKSCVTELMQSNSTPYLLFKRVLTKQDKEQLNEYFYCDFESEILTQSEVKPRVFLKEKEKPNMTKSTKHNLASDTYTMPKSKLTLDEVATYKKSFRLVLSFLSIQEIDTIPLQIRSHFHLDFISEVPAPSILQYNEKLLSVDGISCTKQSQILISQIYEYSRDQLGISLRANDDCVRLFSSFLANLVSEMSLQSDRYGKVLLLLSKLRSCTEVISAEVTQLHSKLKELSVASEHVPANKVQIESQLREKSTALAAAQKLTEILNWLEPSYQLRHNSIKSHLQDRGQLDLTFAITATYFIYLSNLPYTQRRIIFQKWYENVPLMNHPPVKYIDSFLSLFLLYEEEFNAEPVDDLPDFYENMAIIFHSAKPIAIRDDCWRGRQWLERNCSFLYLREDHKEFIETISEYLSKPSNILIEVVKQETMDKLTEEPIGTLLFLPETASSINLRGEEVEVHHEAKVYLLVGKGVVIPRQLQQEFTIVLFSQSEEMMHSALAHEYLSSSQREHQISRLDWHRKIRNLKLDCENAIGQVAESIYEQLCGSDSPPEVPLLCEKLSKITDKLMVKAQNQFTKIKEKEELIVDFQEKYEKISAKIEMEPSDQFHQTAQKVRQALRYMSLQTSRSCPPYPNPPYSQFFSIIKLALSKGIIQNAHSLILLALRQWGPMYSKQDYLIFTLLLAAIINNKPISSITSILTEQGLKKGLIQELIGKQRRILQSEAEIQEIIVKTLVQLFQEDDFKIINPFILARDNQYLPIVWLEKDINEQPDQKIVRILSTCTNQQVKQKISSKHTKILQPTAQESLQFLLKKNNSEEIQIILYSEQQIEDSCKTLKNWGLADKSIIFLHDKTHLSPPSAGRLYEWVLQLENDQSIFMKVTEHYLRKKMELSEEQNLKEKQKEENLQESHHSQLSQTFTISPSQPPAQTMSGFGMSHTLNLHVHQHLDNLDYSNDRLYKLGELFINCIKLQYCSKGLPVPQLPKQQLNFARKMVQNQDSPLATHQKINCMTKCISTTLRNPLPEIESYIQTLLAKLSKLTNKLSTDDEILSQAEVLLSEGKEFEQAKQEESQQMVMELGWLVKTRQMFNLSNRDISRKYLLEIESYSSATKAYTEPPKFSRGSKRQINIKMKRQSISKKGFRRESVSQGRKMQLNQKSTISKLPNSELASLLLLKETQNYERILYRINHDLTYAGKQLENIEQTTPSQSTISLLLDLIQNQPIPSWKVLLCEIGCGNLPLSLAIRHIITRRNELFTYQSKLSISQSCEIDFKYIRRSAEFLRAYFRSELSSMDSFVITNTLSSEELERGECLRVIGMWGLGWRLSPEGIIENLGESKAIQLSSCYLVKKTNAGVGMNAIDLYISPEAVEPLMRVYAQSKKAQTGAASKLYLRMQN